MGWFLESVGRWILTMASPYQDDGLSFQAPRTWNPRQGSSSPRQKPVMLTQAQLGVSIHLVLFFIVGWVLTDACGIIRMTFLWKHIIRMVRKRIIFAIGMMLSTSALAWQPSPLHTKTLSNGLRIVVQVNKQSPASIFEIWYGVGSIDEPLGQTGISHLLEHLMFRGTSDHPGGYFSKAISKVGGWDNAFTSYDYTAYVDALSNKNLPLAFELEADRMKHLQFSVQTFEKEKKVVQEERLMRVTDNPVSKLMERFNAVANMGSPLVNPIIGWPGDIAQISYAQIYDWYAKWYQPQNATIVIVGDVKPAKMFDLATQYFGRMSGVQLPVQPQFSGLKNPGERSVYIKLKSKVPTLAMGFKVPSLVSVKRTSEWKPYALFVAAAILDGGESSRLKKDLVRNQKLVSSISLSYRTLARLDNQFMIVAIPSAGVSFNQVESGVWSELNTLKTALISSSELARVKRQMLAQQIYSMDSLFGTANQIGRIAVVGLPLNTFTNYVNRIDQVTPKQIRAVAREYFKHNNLTVGMLKPVVKSTQLSGVFVPQVQASNGEGVV